MSREHGISLATLYQWKSKYSSLEAFDLKPIKELEVENNLESRAIKDLLGKL